MECARPLAGGARISLANVDEVLLERADKRLVERRRVDGKVTLRVGVSDKRMSSGHARIVLGSGRVEIADLGSTNGTLVQGARIERALLTSGQVFELGQTLFMYGEIEERPAWQVRDVDYEAAPAEPPGLATLDPLHAGRLARLKRIGISGVTVMLLGETGTGKEVLARAVHTLSRRPGPFVAVNCGAIPPTLLESQLFGHVEGAFSGASRNEPGLVRSAQSGTLFLDEIGDLPPASQAALLRMLQEGEVLPVGATRPVRVDVRVVSATHCPLAELMDSGKFRRDLYARLAGFVYDLPPLRDRCMDLGLLVAALLRSPKVRGGEALRFAIDAGRALARYEWPLNVRELEQCLVASSVLADEAIVRLEDLPASLQDASAPPSSPDAGDTADRDEAIRRELLLRLAEHRGNVSEVARAMGKARQQIQRWIRRFGIEVDALRPRE
jgi:transcriptional regulator with PAS, ATPase and Fis domain